MPEHQQAFVPQYSMEKSKQSALGDSEWLIF
jgi:hypothetical protein